MSEWNVPEKPTDQRPLRRGKRQPNHGRWIVIACGADTYDLDVIEQGQDSSRHGVNSRRGRPYSVLWSDLCSLQLDRRAWWLIGFDVRRALARSHWLQALADGAIHTPLVRGGSRKGERGGRMVLSPDCVDIDIVCGRNKIKVLDYGNYAIRPADYGDGSATVTIDRAVHVLREFLCAFLMTTATVTRATAAQIGWARFRSMTWPCLPYVNMDEDCRTLERRAYFGGRNEPYYLGDFPGEVFSLDVRSCYASVCVRRAVPIRLIEEYRAGCEVNTISVTDSHHWIADVVLQTDAPDYPLKWCGKTIYPVGTFATSLCWPELRHALECGRVIRVLRAARYEAGCLFGDFARWFEASKARLNEAGLYNFAGPLKLAFNAALGYTARRAFTWLPLDSQMAGEWAIGLTDSPEDHSTAVQFRCLGESPDWLRVGGEPREAMPAIHGTIGSWARIKLLDILQAAGREHVLYCDTDGILVDRAGMTALGGVPGMIGELPGQLCERWPSGKCRIQGQKNYRIGKHWIACGQARTRYSGLVEKQVLTTDTGRVRLDGYVEPFEFTSEPHDGEREGWTNQLV